MKIKELLENFTHGSDARVHIICPKDVYNVSVISAIYDYGNFDITAWRLRGGYNRVVVIESEGI